MKFTIFGFSQRNLLNLGLDLTDAAILRWFVDFKDTGEMVTEIFGNEQYYWIKYKKIIEDIPIAKLKTKDSIYRRLKKMANAEVLDHKTKKQSGIYSFYKLGSKYRELINDNLSDINPTAIGYKSVTLSDEKSEQNINLLKDINNSSSNKEFVEIKKIFDNNIHPMTPIEAEKLAAYLEDDGMDYRLIIRAIEIAVCNASRNLRYIEGILKKWRDNNLLTLEAVESYARDYQDRKQKRGAGKDGHGNNSKKESGNAFEGYKPPEPKISDELAGLTDEELDRLIEEQGL